MLPQIYCYTYTDNLVTFCWVTYELRNENVDVKRYGQLFCESGGRGLPLRPTRTTLLSH